MRKLNFFFILVAMGFMISCNDSTTTTKTDNDSTTNATNNADSANTSRDGEFVSEEVAGNYAEVKLAQLAKTNGTDAELKRIADMLEKDHTAALNDLKAFASKKNITVPSEESSDHKDKYNDIADEKKGSEFDKKWLKELIDKHEKTIKKYEDGDIGDSELKTWATNALPKLRHHRDELQKAHDKLK